MGWAARARAAEPKPLLWEWGMFVKRIRVRNVFSKEKERVEFDGHAIAVKYGSFIWHFRVEDYPGLG